MTPPSAPVQQSESLIVTVVVDDGGGNKYAIDGVQQDSLNLVEGETYVFDWSGASGHPFRFVYECRWHYGGGVEYVDGVVVDHVAVRLRLRLHKVRRICITTVNCILVWEVVLAY